MNIFDAIESMKEGQIVRNCDSNYEENPIFAMRYVTWVNELLLEKSFKRHYVIYCKYKKQKDWEKVETFNIEEVLSESWVLEDFNILEEYV